MEKFIELREKYKTFKYIDYKVSEYKDCILITYTFEIDGLCSFTPTWKFPKGKFNLDALNDITFNKMIFNLGMVELISYWKITCSKKVVVECGTLTDEMISFWKKLYFNGLGEFFYLNGINTNQSDFMSICSTGFGIVGDLFENQKSGILIPVGGGKDSSVSIEILKKSGQQICTYIINSRGATENTVLKAGLSEKQNLRVQRTLDKNMIECNKKGFLNGHTPFSAIVAFSSIICAYLNSLEYVALSNEASANESTVKGMSVNHQYSKSFEFENDFNEYEKRFIGSGIHYFSLLRALSEYQIAGIFAQYKQYHGVFRSCNAGSKTDIWCGKCPKCLFVFIIMSPFLCHDDIVSIFNCDMLDDEEMTEIFNKLIGLSPEKPFECVGSRDEVNFSLCEAINKLSGKKLPILLEKYKKTDLYKKYSESKNPFKKYFDNENLIDEKFIKLLKEELNNAKII